MVQENELNQEIEAKESNEKRYGWYNYIAAYTVAVLALMGSIASSLLAALEVNKLLTAVVAIIPAVVLAITRIFNFEPRAFFHWRKAWTCRKLLNRLKYGENLDRDKLIEEFSSIDLEMLPEWIPFGTMDGENRQRKNQMN